MRELIRPALFMIARLGLFLAVVAWVVGQWCAISTQVPFIGRTVDFGMNRDAVYLHLRSKSPGKLSWRLVRPSDSLWDTNYISKVRQNWAREMSEIAKARRKEQELFNVTGCVVWTGGDPAASVRHWLVVTIFAVFNGVLMWVYRKQGIAGNLEGQNGTDA